MTLECDNENNVEHAFWHHHMALPPKNNLPKYKRMQKQQRDTEKQNERKKEIETKNSSAHW